MNKVRRSAIITLRQTIDELLEIGMVKNNMPDTMRDYVSAQKALVEASRSREATLGRFRTLLEAQLGSSHNEVAEYLLIPRKTHVFFVIFHSVTSCFSIISKQHALQTPCGFLQLSILNKRRGDKADNASFSMEALFHNPSGLASCMNSIRRRSPVGNCRRLE